MGMIQWKECGNPISNKAKSCPKCGAPNDNEKMEWTENRETFIKLGYIFSIVSFFIFPVILGIAGFILGIFNFLKRENTHGIMQIGIATISLMIEFMVEI